MASEKSVIQGHARRMPRVWMALRVCIALLAVFALRRELNQVDPGAVGRDIVAFGSLPIIIAFACAGGSFLALGIFELLALRDTASYPECEAAAKVPHRTAFLTSFVANAFSQSIGLAVVTGAAVRLRAYSRYGIGAAAVTRISAFVTITTTLGLLTAGALAIFESPVGVTIRGYSFSMRLFGILLALPPLAYVAWAFSRKGTIGSDAWRTCQPSRRLALLQVTLSVLDWMLTGTILFVLLPATAAVGYFMFLGAYLVAQTVGVVSHVPGGLGVFESVFLSLLVFAGNGASLVAASLVMYRVVYYLVPLVIAIAIAGVADLRRRRLPALSSRLTPSRRASEAVHAG